MLSLCQRNSLTRALCCVAALFAAVPVMADPRPPQVVERETRVFRISVDGTERGQCTMQIRRRDDGVDWVGGNAGLLFNYYVYKYRFSSGGAALWKDGRLLQMDRTANFNGTQYHVTANTTRDGLVIATNGRSSLNSPELWSTTAYQLPARWTQAAGIEPSGVRSVVILDADTGQKRMGRLRRLPDEAVPIAGEQKSCLHYHVGGDVDVHLWYDAHLRLVRRQSVDSGHKVLMDLMQLTAE